MGHLVARRAHEHRAQLPRQASRRGVPRQDGAHLGRRAGRGSEDDLRRAARRGVPARGRAASAWHQARRSRRHLHADVPRGRGVGAGGRQDRGGLHPAVLRLRTRGDRNAVEGRRGEVPHLRRRLLPARPGGADEGDRGPRAAVMPDRDQGDRAPARRARRPVDPRSRPGVGGAARGRARQGADARDGPGRPADDHLHVRHDRQAEGHAARARRISCQGRAGHGTRLRHRRRGHRLLVHRPRLDDGTVAHLRLARPGRDDGAVRGHARPPRARQAVADGRAARGHGVRSIPHPRAEPDDARR